jgi:hypothetical protein
VTLVASLPLTETERTAVLGRIITNG